MSALDDLIKNGRTLISERDSMKVDRDAEKARADKAEADRDALQAQIDADAKKAADAAAELQAEIDAEAPSSAITGSVAAATTAPTTTVVVTGDAAIPAGAVLSGPGISDGTTASDVAVTTAVDGSAVSTITLSQPTTEDHVGDQTETVTATLAPVVQ